MKREKSDLRAQYDAFLADNEDYLKELDASRLGKTLEDAKKMKAKFLARFPGLEQREEAAISEVDKSRRESTKGTSNCKTWRTTSLGSLRAKRI